MQWIDLKNGGYAGTPDPKLQFDQAEPAVNSTRADEPYQHGDKTTQILSLKRRRQCFGTIQPRWRS
jgi:hypothetical protein